MTKRPRAWLHAPGGARVGSVAPGRDRCAGRDAGCVCDGERVHACVLHYPLMRFGNCGVRVPSVVAVRVNTGVGERPRQGNPPARRVEPLFFFSLPDL